MEALTVNSDTVTVRKFKPTMVQPESDSPDGFYFLSSLDQAIPFTMKTIDCFEKGGDEVLVCYYPLKETMANSAEGHFIVECMKKGVPLGEAEASCSVHMLGDIRIPNADVKRKLYLHHHEHC